MSKNVSNKNEAYISYGIPHITSIVNDFLMIHD